MAHKIFPFIRLNLFLKWRYIKAQVSYGSSVSEWLAEQKFIERSTVFVHYIQRVAAQPHHLHFTRTTVMLTLSNQTEIWCEASYDQNLMPNEILAHFDD